MTNVVEYLLSQEVEKQVNMPYLSMSSNEKEELEKLREMFAGLSASEKEFVRENSDAFFVAKLEAWSLEVSIPSVVGSIASYLS